MTSTMEKNYTHMFNDAADNYIESSFDDDSPANSFEPDNLFGIAIGKKARRRKSLRNNAATVDYNRKQADLTLQQRAIDQSLEPSTVALQNVQAQQPLINSYVQSQGQVPQPNPAALALQANSLFQSQIEQKQAQGVPDFDVAHDAVISDMQDSWGDEESEEFFGDLFSSIYKAGSALIGKINKKREDKGLKPLFAGKNWQKMAEKMANNETVIEDGLNANERALLALTRKEIDVAKKNDSPVGAAVRAIKADQTRQAIRDYLPYIVIAAVVIYLIGKHT